MKAGPYLYGLVGTTMIFWGILAIRWLDPIGQQPRASKKACLLALPCPAYLVAMIVSLRLAREFIHLPGLVVGAALGTGFVALGWLSQMFLRAARGRSLAQHLANGHGVGPVRGGDLFSGDDVSPGRDA